MFLKNYTSEVPVSQTIYRIEQVLIKCGVSGITKEYKGNNMKPIDQYNTDYADEINDLHRLQERHEAAERGLYATCYVALGLLLGLILFG